MNKALSFCKNAVILEYKCFPHWIKIDHLEQQCNDFLMTHTSKGIKRVPQPCKQNTYLIAPLPFLLIYLYSNQCYFKVSRTQLRALFTKNKTKTKQDLLLHCSYSLLCFVCVYMWTCLDRSVFWWGGSSADDQPGQHLPVLLEQDLWLSVCLWSRERQQGSSWTPLRLCG